MQAQFHLSLLTQLGLKQDDVLATHFSSVAWQAPHLVQTVPSQPLVKLEGGAFQNQPEDEGSS